MLESGFLPARSTLECFLEPRSREASSTERIPCLQRQAHLAGDIFGGYVAFFYDPRIHPGFERDHLGPVTDSETCLIGAGRRHRAAASGPRGIFIPWPRIAQIPIESVHARTLVELGCAHAFEPPLAHARFLGQDVGLTAGVARETAHELALSIENFNRDLSRGLARKVVVDAGACFGILRLVG